jgi:hypothetical protein
MARWSVRFSSLPARMGHPLFWGQRDLEMLGEVASDVFDAQVAELREIGAEPAAEDDPRLGGLFELALRDDALFYEIVTKGFHRPTRLRGSTASLIGRLRCIAVGRLRFTVNIGIVAAIH